ncbi:uncharacterized protein LOC114933734 [Nylanderia fulva]|uniref:uncharacterized protein LOC114933734 n=1 Tax=Nylanderia fulva TaxID=613905 RepID=UPI0010FB3D1D|nr:uncharacterized protein LOC114933734 [Nylanderia fulva]
MALEQAILSLNENSRMCVVYSYVVPQGDMKLCLSCFMTNRGQYTSACVTQRHQTMRYKDIPYLYCYDCLNRLFTVFLARNRCLVCQSRAAESDSALEDETIDDEDED